MEVEVDYRCEVHRGVFPFRACAENHDKYARRFHLSWADSWRSWILLTFPARFDVSRICRFFLSLLPLLRFPPELSSLQAARPLLTETHGQFRFPAHPSAWTLLPPSPSGCDLLDNTRLHLYIDNRVPTRLRKRPEATGRAGSRAFSFSLAGAQPDATPGRSDPGPSLVIWRPDRSRY